MILLVITNECPRGSGARKTASVDSGKFKPIMYFSRTLGASWFEPFLHFLLDYHPVPEQTNLQLQEIKN